MRRITLLTESRYHKPVEIDWYIQQVLDEDRLIQDALQQRGFVVDRKAWSDPKVNWNEQDVLIFRSTWDYFHRFEDFRKWLSQLPPSVTCINPVELIQWNLDKHYFNDLKSKGVEVVPSSFRCPAEAGDANMVPDLSSWCDEFGGEEWVLKPAISGAGRHTYRFRKGDIQDLEAAYSALLKKECLLLQPFQQRVLTEGEVSVMVVDGTITHSVRKIAKPGDFRVQDDFGGSVVDHVASDEERDLAERAIAACSPRPLYGRVDILTINNGQKAVSELELIEPEMWFRKKPKAAVFFAEAAAKSLDHS